MNNKFLRFDENDIGGLRELGISCIFVEISYNGKVVREIGLDDKKLIVYKHPGSGRFAEYGLFDVANIDVSNLSSDISQDEFERLYQNTN